MILTPPYSIEAEKAILGSILLENNLMYTAMQKIDENAFYIGLNKKIYKAYKLLIERNISFDILTILDILQKKRKQEDLEKYIISLIEHVSTKEHFNNYLEIVLENQRLRNLLELSIKIKSDVENKVESESIIGDISKQILNENQNDLELLNAEQVSKLALDVFDKEEQTFLKTGIKTIDENFQGINRSGLMVLAGHTGNGKTSLALNIAENHIRSGKNVLIFQMEMEAEDMLIKMIADKIKVPSYKIKNKYLSNQEKDKYFNEVAEFSKFNYKICDRGRLTIEKIISIIQVENKKEKIDLVVIDYLGLIDTSNIKSSSLAEKIGYLTKSIKALSRDIKTHILLLSQLNREAAKQKRYPILADLKESSSIEQDADSVMFTHYDEATQQHKIIIAKNRHGECNVFDIHFDKPYSKFN